MAKKKVVDLDKAPLTEEEVVQKALTYNALNTQVKNLSGEASGIKDDLKSYVEENGVKTPNGHLVFERDHAGNTIKLENQARTGARLKADALHILKKSRFKDKVIETYEAVNVDKLEALHQKGVISDEYFASLFDTTTTYAFSVKVAPKKHG